MKSLIDKLEIEHCLSKEEYTKLISGFDHDLSEYPEPVRRSLWEEFCRRAGATDMEKAEAHRDLYDDFKIVYP